MTHKPVPEHVAIIMDGNGRWAQARGLPRLAGHRAGTQNIRRICEACTDNGVKILTLYAFSTENWSRPRPEVEGLMRLFSRTVKTEKRSITDNGIQLRVMGRLEGLPSRLVQEIMEVVEETRNNDCLILNVAFNYGGRAEVVDAARRILADGLRPEELDEARFETYLYTSGMRDPDLVIRTANEMRLSNFLIWQTAYSEYYSTPVYWPDFGKEQFQAALDDYARRQRKFGGL